MEAGENKPECNWPFIHCNTYILACVVGCCFILCFSLVWYFEIYITCGKPYRKKKKYDQMIDGDFDDSLMEQAVRQEPELFPGELVPSRQNSRASVASLRSQTPSVGGYNPFWDNTSSASKAYDKSDP